MPDRTIYRLHDIVDAIHQIEALLTDKTFEMSSLTVLFVRRSSAFWKFQARHLVIFGYDEESSAGDPLVSN
jgi:hypothetical protein